MPIRAGAASGADRGQRICQIHSVGDQANNPRCCAAGAAQAFYVCNFEQQTSVGDRVARFRGNVGARERGDFDEIISSRYNIPSQRTGLAQARA